MGGGGVEAIEVEDFNEVEDSRHHSVLNGLEIIWGGPSWRVHNSRGTFGQGEKYFSSCGAFQPVYILSLPSALEPALSQACTFSEN